MNILSKCASTPASNKACPCNYVAAQDLTPIFRRPIEPAQQKHRFVRHLLESPIRYGNACLSRKLQSDRFPQDRVNLIILVRKLGHREKPIPVPDRSLGPSATQRGTRRSQSGAYSKVALSLPLRTRAHNRPTSLDAPARSTYTSTGVSIRCHPRVQAVAVCVCAVGGYAVADVPLPAQAPPRRS